jgi:alcohol dehydrogenase
VTIGQRVVVPWAISCGACDRCRRGLTSQCQRKASTLAAYGFGGRAGGWGGMVSDLLRVPFADGMLVPVPDGMSPVTLAGASDNLPDAWRTVAPHPIAFRPRGRWLRGSAPPVATRYPITVDASNREAGLEFAIRALAPGGVCTAVGFYFRCGTPLPLWHMYLKGARLHVGISHPRADLPDVLDFIAGGRFDPSRVVARLSRWEDSPEAFLDREPAKVVVARAVAVDPLRCSAVEVGAL